MASPTARHATRWAEPTLRNLLSELERTVEILRPPAGQLRIMPKLNELLVWFPAIEPSAARATVVASCDGPAEGLRLSGWLAGPTCAYAKTVEGETPLVSEPVAEGIKAEDAVEAGAIVMEPCLWEPEHPFLYHAEVALWRDDEKLDEQIVSVGIRHLACDEQGFQINGRRFALTGARVANADRLDEESLAGWHGVGCIAVEAERLSEDLLHRADRLGVFLIVRLPEDSNDPNRQRRQRSGDVRSGNGSRSGGAGELSEEAHSPTRPLAHVPDWRLHPSVAVWTVADEGQVGAVRSLDPTRPIALRTKANDLPEKTDADLLAVSGSPDELAHVPERSSKPVLAWCDDAPPPNAEAFRDALAERQEQLANVPNLAGIVI